MKSHKSTKTNIIWHRRLGLSVFLVLIFLAISGFALNHSPALKLNKINLSNSWLLSWYGFEKPAINGFNLQGQWLYQDGNSQLFLDHKAVAPCSAPLLSTVSSAGTLYALCADALLMLTEKGQFIESFSQLDGLPASALAITVAEGRLYLLTDSEAFTLNPDSLALTPELKLDPAVLAPQPTLAPIPAALEQHLANSGPSISLETVILDLHSGRFFGQFGVLVIDIVGLLICILSITGLMAWINRLRQIKQ